jgi:trans-2,3-dihydro-3-hydroxyanthranilate isomerase
MQWVSTGFPFLIVQLNSLEAVQRASPNPAELMSLLEGQISKQVAIFTTETVNSSSHVHLRMFAPEVGVLEDPATGSCAGPLAAYIEQYNLLKRDRPRRDIIIEQGYEIRRPSRLVASIIGEKDFKGAYVSGKTRLVAEGTFFVEK